MIFLCWLIHFIDQFNVDFKKKIKQFSSSAYDLLEEYDWPGNIRELENVIEHCFILCSGEIIQVEHLPKRLKDFKNDFPKTDLYEKNNFKDLERELILTTLKRNNWSRSKAAGELGIDPSTLWRKMKKLRNKTIYSLI